MHGNERDLSNPQLVDQMWEWLIPAWLGTSLGGCLILGAIFWRFVLRPWHVLIDYGDGDIAWTCHGCRILHAPSPPEIPFIESFIPIGIVAIGVAIIWLGAAPWLAARNELFRRRTKRNSK
jgi:hypothetical protein